MQEGAAQQEKPFCCHWAMPGAQQRSLYPAPFFFFPPTSAVPGEPAAKRLPYPSGEAGMCSNPPRLLPQLAPIPSSPTHGRWDTMTKSLSLGTRCAVPTLSPACQSTGRARQLPRRCLPRGYGTEGSREVAGARPGVSEHTPGSLRLRTRARTPRACPDEPVPPAVPGRGNICMLPVLQRRGQNSSDPRRGPPEHFSYFSLCQGHKQGESDARGDQVQQSRLPERKKID